MNALPVSIIINNYNYGRFLREAVESALGQTHSVVEVIVVDDGSTDDSRAIIESFGERVAAVFKPNGGQGSAFNAGFARAKGDIVMFLDADDVLLPHAAEELASAFTSRRGVARAQFRLEIVDAAGVATGHLVPPRHVRLPSGDLRRYACKPNHAWWTPTSGQAFSASVLRRLFPIPEHVLRYDADAFLLPTSAMLGDVVSFDRVGGYYRAHGANEALATGLDLVKLRGHIERARDMHPYIRQVAQEIDLRDYPMSFSDVQALSWLPARIISLKLEPEHHPLAGDNLPRLVWHGVTAALTRPDVALFGRVLHALWFLALGIAPKGVARALALRFIYPPSRGRVLRVLVASFGRRHT